MPFPLRDGPECTGSAQSRTVISASILNIAFHVQIGHEITFSRGKAFPTAEMREIRE
jgi:hypothetical protein